jgi:hypothetical protein
MKSALRAQEPIIQQYVALLVQRLRERIQAGCDSLSSSSTEQLGRKSDKTGTLVDIFPWLNFTTFDIFGDLGFGESFNCLEHSKYHPWISLIFNSIKAITFLNSVKYYPMFDWLLKKCIPPSMKKMQVCTGAYSLNNTLTLRRTITSSTS